MEKKYFTSQNAKSLINIYGFALFPVHGIKEDGSCTCGNQACNNKGKHPATRNGLKDANNNYEAVVQMYKDIGKKRLNVGVATGKPSNIFVIDIDSEEGYAEIERLCGGIPNTLRVDTAKGCHLYFEYPNEPIITKVKILNGVDVRGDGGYVVGAFSNHENGKIYNFYNPLENIIKAPEHLLDLVVKSRIKENRKPANDFFQEPQTQNFLTSNKTDEEKAREHLSFISPDCSYDEWIAIGMGIKDEGLPFYIWDDWSKGGAKYDNSTANHWKSFKGTGTGYGTVVHMAKQGGWKPKDIIELRQNVDSPAQNVEVYDQITGEITQPTHESKILDNQAIYYTRGDEIKHDLISREFVKGLLTEGSMSVVYGESNCGKTFFMTDVAFHVAQGKPWRDVRVNGGGVLYAVLEGSYGLKGRVQAYRLENEGSLNNFLMMPCPVDFMNPEGNINEFISLLHTAKKEVGDLKLIVIDTLARAMGGGDENSGQDMGILVKHADYIRTVTGAHICFVHHSGKDKAKGARGHSSLRAAIDTEIEVSREEDANYSQVSVVKQRDLSIPDEPYYFTLKQVELGADQYGEAVTSCVVEPCEGIQKATTRPLTAIQSFVYDAIIEAIDTYGVDKTMRKDMPKVKSITMDEMRIVLEERGYKEVMETKNKTTAQQIKSATQSARVALKKAGKINFNKGYVWLANSGEL